MLCKQTYSSLPEVKVLRVEKWLLVNVPAIEQLHSCITHQARPCFVLTIARICSPITYNVKCAFTHSRNRWPSGRVLANYRVSPHTSWVQVTGCCSVRCSVFAFGSSTFPSFFPRTMSLCLSNWVVFLPLRTFTFLLRPSICWISTFRPPKYSWATNCHAVIPKIFIIFPAMVQLILLNC